MSLLLLFNGAAGYGSLFARHFGGGGRLAGPAAFTLAADAATYTLTGADAALRATRRLQADPAAYGLSGAPASTLPARRLQAAAAGYVLTGASVTLTVTSAVSAGFGGLLARGLGGGGSVEIRGFGSLLARGLGGAGGSAAVFSVSAASATYAWSVAPALRDFAVTADEAFYDLVAADVTFGRVRKLAATGTGYVWTARDAGLLQQGEFALVAERATYALVASPADLRGARRLVANGTGYAFSGSVVVLAVFREAARTIRLVARRRDRVLSVRSRGALTACRRERVLAASRGTV